MHEIRAARLPPLLRLSAASGPGIRQWAFRRGASWAEAAAAAARAWRSPTCERQDETATRLPLAPVTVLMTALPLLRPAVGMAVEGGLLRVSLLDLSPHAGWRRVGRLDDLAIERAEDVVANGGRRARIRVAHAALTIPPDEEHIKVPADGAAVLRALESQPAEDRMRVRAVNEDLVEQAEADGEFCAHARLDLVRLLRLLRAKLVARKA